MNIHVVLSLIALTVCAGLLYLSHLCARIAATETTDDPRLVEVGDALFTAKEFAALVEMRATYEADLSAPTTPTTGGEE